MMRRLRRYWQWAVMLIFSVAMWAADATSTKEIDTQKSVMTVRVFKAGLFSAFGHEHEVSAAIQRGTINESGRSVELTVDARQMRVLDPDVSEKDRAKVQQTMLGPEVLDTGQFPEIRFRSTSVERAGEGRWTVRGDLTLHGQTHPVELEVNVQGGHYRGSAQLKQRDFGIVPYSGGGGAVKVKNELRVEFEIVARP